MKRICGLAYALVWAWQEHQRAAEILRKAPIPSITLLIDEVEAHLHPHWQRTILPALLRVLASLQSETKVQVFAATHAPLVLASLEPEFDTEKDALFGFDLAGPKKDRVVVERLPWRRRGDVSDWLTSEVFDLKWARSKEAEIAIEKAIKALDDPKLTPAKTKKIHRELQKTLGDTDPFWSRWRMVAEKAGIAP